MYSVVIAMRNFPSLLHPILGLCLPSLWRLRHGIQKIHALLIPHINERRKNPPLQPREDVVQWMMDLANQDEESAENIANRYIFTIGGSLHTVAAAIVDTMYEAIARPEYIPLLREEIHQALLEERGEWTKRTIAKLPKLDSFMREAQRVNPASASEQPIILDQEKLELIEPPYSRVQPNRQGAHSSIRWASTSQRRLHLHAHCFKSSKNRGHRSGCQPIWWLPILQKSARIWRQN